MAKVESVGKQNVRLKTENAELEQERDTMAADLAEAKARADHYEAVSKQEAPTPVAAPVAVQENPALVEAAAEQELPEILYDPYHSQNPHKFIAHPSGYMLGWKNPSHRENHRGWRGWKPVEFDDFIGRQLKLYLLDPPRRMEHSVDNCVRRGDSLLCFLRGDIWQARQQQRDLKAHRMNAVQDQGEDVTVTVERPVGGKFVAVDTSQTGNRIGGRSEHSR